MITHLSNGYFDMLRQEFHGGRFEELYDVTTISRLFWSEVYRKFFSSLRKKQNSLFNTKSITLQ